MPIENDPSIHSVQGASSLSSQPILKNFFINTIRELKIPLDAFGWGANIGNEPNLKQYITDEDFKSQSSYTADLIKKWKSDLQSSISQLEGYTKLSNYQTEIDPETRKILETLIPALKSLIENKSSFKEALVDCFGKLHATFNSLKQLYEDSDKIDPAKFKKWQEDIIAIETSKKPPPFQPPTPPVQPPVTPVTPSEPPVQPVTPVTPTEPPVQPVTPVAPSEPPVQPVTPVTPSEPPVQPVTPTTPTEPPVQPVTPVAPSEPPVIPDQPPSTEPSLVDWASSLPSTSPVTVTDEYLFTQQRKINDLSETLSTNIQNLKAEILAYSSDVPGSLEKLRNEKSAISDTIKELVKTTEYFRRNLESSNYQGNIQLSSLNEIINNNNELNKTIADKIGSPSQVINPNTISSFIPTLEKVYLTVNDSLKSIEPTQDQYIKSVNTTMSRIKNEIDSINSSYTEQFTTLQQDPTQFREAYSTFGTSINEPRKQLKEDIQLLKTQVTDFQNLLQKNSYPNSDQFTFVREKIDQFNDASLFEDIHWAIDPGYKNKDPEHYDLPTLTKTYQDRLQKLTQTFDNLNNSINTENDSRYSINSSDTYIAFEKRNLVRSMNDLVSDFDQIKYQITEYTGLESQQTDDIKIVLTSLSEKKKELNAKINSLQDRLQNLQQTLQRNQYPDPSLELFHPQDGVFANFTTISNKLKDLVNNYVPSIENPIDPNNQNLTAGDPTRNSVLDDTYKMFDSLKSRSNDLLNLLPTQTNYLQNFKPEEMSALQSKKQALSTNINYISKAIDAIEEDDPIWEVANGEDLLDLNFSSFGQGISTNAIPRMKNILEELQNTLMKSAPTEYIKAEWDSKISNVLQRLDELKYLVVSNSRVIDGNPEQIQTWNSAKKNLQQAISELPALPAENLQVNF